MAAAIGRDRPHRLFFAIRPTASVIPYIEELRPARRAGETDVAADHLHVTLVWLGDFPQSPEPLLIRSKAVAAKLAGPPLRIVLDTLVSGEKRILLMPQEPLPGLSAFHARLRDALLRAGIESPDKGRYRPHMTLRYGTVPGATVRIEPISWRAEEFVLIHSLLGESRHVTVGRWPLG